MDRICLEFRIQWNVWIFVNLPINLFQYTNRVLCVAERNFILSRLFVFFSVPPIFALWATAESDRQELDEISDYMIQFMQLIEILN